MGLTQVSTDGVKNDAITKTKIPANQIEASELADNAVDTNAIADNAVTAGKLASGVQTTINNNADNRVITGSGTANTLNGESSVVIDANSNVGIGTTSPVEILHIKEGTNKNVHFTGGIGQIGNVTGLFAVNDANNAIVDIGICGSTVRVGTTAGERARFTGDGLCFNGDTAAANAISDYEEGVFTPSATVTTTLAQGRYVKIGNMVYAFWRVTFASTSSGLHAKITGLPFTSGNTNPSTGGVAHGYTNIQTDNINIIYHIGNNSTTLEMFQGAGSAMPAASVSEKDFRGCAIYQTS